MVKSSERQAVLDAIKRAGEPAGPKQIAVAANMRPGNVRQLLLKLLKEGAVKRVAYGTSRQPPRKPRGSYNCPSVGSSNARSPGSTAAAASPRTGKISTAAPSRS
jgi:hypothetical protein